MRFIVSAPKPFEDLLAQELTALSITPTGTDGSSVSFEGELEDAYQVVLYSRVATRIVLELARGPVDTPDDVYSLVKSVDWSEHLAPAGTLSVNYQGTGAGIRNTQFGGQKVKDAIVDQFREKAFGRPDVDPKRPDLSISARFRSGELSVGFDLGGGSLHRRGYRPRTIEAPLKENLAAALLMRAGWPREQVLLDPMCGSGTLLVEAAMMAFDIAPGLMRPALGFGKWLGHDRELWNRLRSKAKARRDDAPRHAEILGADVDERAIRAAEEAVMRASLEGAIKLECRDARSWAPKLSGDALLISNLPYGERLGEAGPELRGLYRESGQFWRESFHGGRFALLVPKDDLSHHLPLKVDKKNTVWNGRLECWLLQGALEKPDERKDAVRSESRSQIANRLRKNEKRLRSWVKREAVEAYRIYDADMPEFAVAIDRYGDWLHIQEYAAPKTVNAVRAQERLDDVMAAAPEALAVDPANIVLKVRERQRGSRQYEKHDIRRERLQIKEGEVTLLVNLHDYLDTGVFLDHRPTRLRLAELARGKRFLNLFCYTGAATVHCGKAGASSTTSVDLSNTYLQWTEDNLRTNGIEVGRNHHLVRADVMKWIADCQEHYDLIFCDPPVFSNSKSMDDAFDVQRDHKRLIECCMERLSPEGLLVFSTNLRKFKLDPALNELFDVKDVTARSIPKDFERNARIHVCFDIRARADGR